NALGGRVELAGLAAPGEVALNVDDNHLSLNIPNDLTRADISLTNEAVINTSGEGGGEIQVFGRRVILKEGSQILATTLGSEAGEGITVDASELVELIGTGFENFEQIFIAGGLFGQIRPFNPGTGLFTGTVGTGLGGVVAINTGELILRDGAIIFSPTFGEGSGGSLSVRASESVEAIGSGLITSTLSNATGAAGDITVSTKQLIVRDGAIVAAATLGEGTGAEIVVRASKSVEVLRSPAGVLVPTGIFASTIGGTGRAGGITIDTGRLIVRGGAQMGTQSGSSILGIPSRGQGGNLVIRASESVEVTGFTADNGSPSGLFSSTSSLGNAGNLTINTRQLLLQDGAEISASSTFGTGNGGNLTIHASESVQLIGAVDGRRLGSFIPSDLIGGGLFTQTRIAGNAGDLTINTGYLLVQDGMKVSAITSAGKGSNITVTANTVEIVNGGQLLTSTEARQDAGNINLRVRDRIILIGTDSGLFANTTEDSSGNGGSIFINNPTSVLIRDGARVTVNSQGIGQGGNIEIRADSLSFDNKASLIAETASSTGGGITLLLDSFLLLREGSRISTTAGTAQAGGDGGNITINADVIAAVPDENSDITANAFFGQGGRITITSQGIFGIEERPAIEENRTNDIDASSQFGNPGEITLHVSLDPSRGLTQLPSTFVDPSGQINRTCAASNRQNQFTITGRGGLPENPTDLFSPDLVQDDFGTVIAREEDEEIEGQAEGKNDLINHPPKQIIEAQGWIIDEEGNVVLTAYVPNGTPHGGWQNSVNCQVSETASP
ncbi:MAG: S-layer family protein, partial [Coleofasciculus sp. E2-BRE-01]